MAANSNKLTALKVKKVNAVGRYADGNCLYLYVDKLGSKRWVLRLVVRGRRRDMGPGSVNLVNLKRRVIWRGSIDVSRGKGAIPFRNGIIAKAPL